MVTKFHENHRKTVGPTETGPGAACASGSETHLKMPTNITSRLPRNISRWRLPQTPKTGMKFGDKLGTNWGQTGDKRGTNGGQTGDATARNASHGPAEEIPICDKRTRKHVFLGHCGYSRKHHSSGGGTRICGRFSRKELHSLYSWGQTGDNFGQRAVLMRGPWLPCKCRLGRKKEGISGCHVQAIEAINNTDGNDPQNDKELYLKV